MIKEPVIVVENVSKSFVKWIDNPNSIKTLLSNLLKLKFDLGKKDTYEVVKNLNFTIYKSDFVGIMGRNGVGKSTLLKMLSGIYSPTSGCISIKGKIVPLLELGAGFAPDLSGYENIFLNASILGFKRQEIDSKINEIIAFSELGDQLYKPVKNYSSGMLVRLGFSIASHVDADVLFFDEILAVGDAGFQKKCLAKINEMHLQNRTIILVTHDPGQVAAFCNRCIVIDDKGILFEGTAAEGAEVYKNLF